MGIGSLQPDVPADNVSAGGGNEELKNIKSQIQVSFPNWDGTDSNDILQATATEVDEAVGKASTALQSFNGRSGPAISTQNDDVTIQQIDDSTAFRPVARTDRVFPTVAELTKLSGIEDGATNIQDLHDVGDCAPLVNADPGQFIQRGTGDQFWNPVDVYQPLYEYARWWNPAEDTVGTNATITFNTEGGLSDYGSLFTVTTSPRITITLQKACFVWATLMLDGQFSAGSSGTVALAKNVTPLSTLAGDIARSDRLIYPVDTTVSGDQQIGSATYVGYLPANTVLRVHVGKNMDNFTPNDGELQIVAVNAGIL